MLIVALCGVDAHTVAQAQQMPERSLVRRGNRNFERGNYDKATQSYLKALELLPTSSEATYNLGNSLYKSAIYEEAEAAMAVVAADSLQSREAQAEAFYNLGNIQFDQQKLNEALQSYRNSLRLNPSDRDARYNYFLTKKLLDQQQQNEDDQQNENDQDDQENQDQNDDQDENGDQDQEGENDQDQDQEGENDQDQNGDQDPEQEGENEQDQDQNGENESDQNGDQESPQQPQPQPSGLSEQEQQQLLDAIQAQEDRTQDKIEGEEARAVRVRGMKHW